MNGRTSLDGEDLSPVVAARVDGACDRFEAEWRAGRRPRIEAGPVVEDPGPWRSAPLYHLLKVELAYRRLGGEGPTAEEYRRRFPDDAAPIERAFEKAASDGAAEVPTQIGKYPVVRALGRGSQATSLLAFDPDLRRHVVLKR